MILTPFNFEKNQESIMNKWKSLGAAFLVGAMMLTACGGQEAANGSGETTQQESTADGSAESTGEGTTGPQEATGESQGASRADGGQVLAMYGTPKVDGQKDDIWYMAGEMDLEIVSSNGVTASGTTRVLWDENYLYTLTVVKDNVLNQDSANTYEQDSVEIFLDEFNEKATSYQSDDVHYRVNYLNKATSDNGDADRLVTAVTRTTGEDGKVDGYIVEMAVAFTQAPANGQVMGFEMQINDAGSQGSRVGTVNLFDASGNAWSDPSKMGEVLLDGKKGDDKKVSTKSLENLIAKVEELNLIYYENPEILTEPLAAAKAVLEQEELTQEAVDAARSALNTAYTQLDDGCDLPEPITFTYNDDITDPYVMMDGTTITEPKDWQKRADELSEMYQYYMYGVWRDGSDEEVTYDYKNNQLTIHIKRISTGAETSFTATVGLPDASKEAPADGYPLVVGMHAGISEGTAHENGFATITLDGFGYPIASDDTSHKGAFYDLYPYGSHWKEQTGVLMAWGWGASKVLDALEAGAGEELNIDSNNSIVTGVSRWGKATIVCGAFEKRFRMVAPSCSGAGGTALFRYTSEGNTYDFSSKGGSSAYTYSQNEPLGSLQAMSERGWFNNKFLSFDSARKFPFDQHLLSSLVADEDRYLFIIGSCVSEDWVNAPSMWFSYLATKEIYDFLGISDNIKINIHKEGHAVIPEDMEYMTQYFNQKVYGVTPESDLSVLDTSVFDLDVNKDPIWDTFTENWTIK